MNSQLAGKKWFEETIEQNSRVVAEPALPWLEEVRAQARASVHQLPVPHRKQEEWRYSRPENLYEQRFIAPAAPVTALDQDDITAWVYPVAESYRLVFANGYFVPGLSTSALSQGELKIGSLREALTGADEQIVKRLSQSVWQNTDIFTALNMALMNDGLYIHVPENLRLARPIEIAYLSFNVERQVAAQIRSLVILDAGAQASLIEHFISTGDSDYFAGNVSGLFLGGNAVLHHYRLQNESRNAHHLSRVSVQQHTASEYRCLNIATGGRWSRSDIQVHFSGPQANCDLEGVFTAGDGQYSDYHLDIQHGQPACRSRANFRSIVHGKGQAVFDGRILVGKDAQKSDALLTNKNLLLSEDAEVDTKPQLEIYADDVQCGHGTTVGRLDPEQIYYLRSRGIDEDEAHCMLSMGFAEQVLEHVPDERLHDAIAAQISARLARQEVSP